MKSTSLWTTGPAVSDMFVRMCCKCFLLGSLEALEQAFGVWKPMCKADGISQEQGFDRG